MNRQKRSRSLQMVRPALACVAEKLVEYVGHRTDVTSTILEVGCGVKSFAAEVLRQNACRFELHGLDINSYARDNSDVSQVIIADVNEMPFRNDVYDVLTSNYMLEHLPDYRKALIEMARIIRKEGMLLLVFPNPMAPEALVARMTPLWFHVLFRRLVQRRPHAEEHTFATCFSFKSVQSVVDCLKSADFTGVVVHHFAETHYRFRHWPVMRRMVSLYAALISRLRWDSIKSSVVIIARK